MAAYTSWRSLDPIMGLDFNQTYATVNAVSASGTSATGNLEESNLPGDSLGTRHTGTNDSEFVLVKASTTITQYTLICWDDAFNANPLTTALALAGKNINVGVPQFTTYQGQIVTSADPSTNPVFWVAVRGNGMQVQVSGSSTVGVQLTTGGIGNQVSISTTGTNFYGLSLLATGGASGIYECTIRYPKATAIV